MVWFLPSPSYVGRAGSLLDYLLQLGVEEFGLPFAVSVHSQPDGRHHHVAGLGVQIGRLRERTQAKKFSVWMRQLPISTAHFFGAGTGINFGLRRLLVAPPEFGEDLRGHNHLAALERDGALVAVDDQSMVPAHGRVRHAAG